MKLLRLISVIALVAILVRGKTECQVQDTIQRREEMPRLEIPEITIVGKKAITLPFARKGEIFDVNIYQAPPPDTSLLLERPPARLQVGSLPRYEQREMPWRLSAEGSLGTFSTGNVQAYLDYKAQRWGASLVGGYSTTQGHTTNASGSGTNFAATVHSLVDSDNDVLRNFRGSAGFGFKHESFGLYGFQPAGVERRRDNVNLKAALGSLNRQGTILDAALEARIWNVKDVRAGVDSEASVVSPLVSASLASEINQVRFIAELSYANSSLDYQHSVESPGLLSFSAGARWSVEDWCSLQLGGVYAGGTDSRGESRTIVAPYGSVRWELVRGSSLAVWFKPEMQLLSYDDEIRQNPCLNREIALAPERKPVNVGSSFWYDNGFLTLELHGTYTRSTNKPVTIADSGQITLEYVDANQTTLQINGSLRVSDEARLKFSGTVQPAEEDGSSVQLPMTPVVRLGGRGELDTELPLTLWASVDYWSKQNVDRAGTQTIGDVFLVGSGASTTFLSRIALSARIENIFNSAYEWWSGYIAPGRRIMIEAKLRLQ